MDSSPLTQHDVSSDVRGGRGYGDGRYGYRRHFPLWVVFPLIFLLIRAPFFWWGYGGFAPNGRYVPGFLALIPLLLLGFLILRYALPLLDDAVRPVFRRNTGAVPDDERTQRLESALSAAHRQIKELEEKVAWQSKFLEIQAATPAAPQGGNSGSERAADEPRARG